MRLTMPTTEPTTLPSPWSQVRLGSLDYVMRDPQGNTSDARIDLFAFPDEATRVGASFTDAVRAAQELAQVPIDDTLHELPVFQAHGVLRDEAGAWWVAPLGGPHRGFTGPVFIDGEFFDRSAVTVVGERAAGGALQAIVGAQLAIDLRDRPRTRRVPVDQLVAGSVAHADAD